MRVSPSQLNFHTKSYLCPKQSVPEEIPEYGAEYKFTEISDQKHQSRPEPGDTSNVVSLYGATEALLLSSENLTKTSLPENYDPPSEDVCKSSLTDKNSGSKLTAKDQKLEFGSDNTHSKVGAVGAHSGLPREIDSLGSSTFIANESLQPLSEDIAKNSLTKGLEFPCQDTNNSQIDKSSCHFQSMTEQTLECDSHGATREPSEERPKPANELLHGESTKINTVLSSCTATVHLEPSPADVTKSSPLNCFGLPPDYEINIPSNEKLGLPLNNMGTHSNLEQSEAPSKDAVSKASRAGRRVKSTAKSSRKKYVLRSLMRSDRVLRSRLQEKPKGSNFSANLANVSSKIEKSRRRKKKKQGKRIEDDEYSRIRKHLRYLLNRMSYEQSLITAYSAEGWKGLSLEKLKPEKELQRATSEILRRKMKIRDLFQRIGSLCAEGRLPESLFDSEGQISSEDIFCAKCGSKDLTADNDIILCDGACDRGFHQFCLVPPLLNEDIPPDDEGWLCPACDCKVDCIELLNDSQGTNISISDSWEKVFPEAAAAGQYQDQNAGLPSDDSDDNDYDPDRPEIDKKSQEDESSSDDSDFTSASDELQAPPHDEQPMGLPSDDSEDDDDYNPDAPDPDENVKEESSSSDFTSDSEDLAATLDDELSGEDQSHMSTGPQEDYIKEGTKHGGKKQQSLNSELLSILEQNSSQDGSEPISMKRNVERLDYKKLYDETYGNVSSDSSDEDFSDTVGPRKRRKSTEVTAASVNGNAPVTETVQQGLKETTCTPKGSCQKSNFERTSISQDNAHEGSSRSSSSGKTVRQSVYRRLGEAVTQGLYKSFKENQHPDRAAKERLAKELGITFQQVTKWFENARWSFNHSSPIGANTVRQTAEKDSPRPKTNVDPLNPGPDTVSKGATCNGTQSEGSLKNAVDAMVENHTGDASKLSSQDSNKLKCKTPNSRKRKHVSDHQISGPHSITEETGKRMAGLPKAQASGRITRSKSVA